MDSVREYFQHFKVLEIDYTFYAPLIENGVPTPCANTLKQYSMHMGPEDRVFLKAPQMFFAQKLRRGKDYAPNENYLAADAFTRQFYEPALSLLGPNLKGIIFEQEYQRQSERTRPWNSQPNSTAFSARFHVITGTTWSCERRHTSPNP